MMLMQSSLAKTLRNLRLYYGESQEQLSYLTHIPLHMIMAIEDGLGEVELDTLLTYATTFDMYLSSLIRAAEIIQFEQGIDIREARVVRNFVTWYRRNGC